MTVLSLRQRLSALAGCLAFVLIALAWILVTVASHRYAYHHERSVFRAVCRELLEEMEPLQTAEGDFPEMVEEIHEAIRMTSERLVVMHVRNGVVVARSHPDEPKWPPVDDSGVWMMATLPYHGEQLVAAMYYGDTKDSLNRQAAALGIGGVCFFLLATASTWFLVGRVLSPLKELSDQALAAEADAKTRLVPPSSDSELVNLVSTLNLFLDGLARASQSRSRFYSAASHELRTPLQALSGHLQLALNRERDRIEYKVALEEAKTQTDRLIRLTQDLLTLNRLETSSETEGQLLDLADYCENAWSTLAARAQEKGLHVSFELADEFKVRSSPSYLNSICRNLLENAVKYAVPGGNIVIQAGNGKFRVYNDCVPLRREDVERLCEPFFRPDESRNSLLGGNGLGLALVSSIVQHEGWEMQLSQSGEGFEVVILLPSQPL